MYIPSCFTLQAHPIIWHQRELTLHVGKPLDGFLSRSISNSAIVCSKNQHTIIYSHTIVLHITVVESLNRSESDHLSVASFLLLFGRTHRPTRFPHRPMCVQKSSMPRMDGRLMCWQRRADVDGWVLYWVMRHRVYHPTKMVCISMRFGLCFLLNLVICPNTCICMYLLSLSGQRYMSL